jgi:hypothetical protein
MASRPVYVPDPSGLPYSACHDVSFDWNAGFAAVQKRKNVLALHTRAAESGLTPLLEISSKSELEVGRRLSAFSLKLTDDTGRAFPLECVFQASKVYRHGGPFVDLLTAEPRDAKRDPRHRSSGPLVAFRFRDYSWPLEPQTAFYNWLYISALTTHHSELPLLQQYKGFTDIEFNPQKSVNCQAQALAVLIGMERAGVLDRAMTDEVSFLRTFVDGRAADEVKESDPRFQGKA